MNAIQEREFLTIPKRAWIGSLFFHIGFTLFLITSPEIQKLIPALAQKPLTQEVVQNFIQVDVVALPDETFENKKWIDLQKPIVEKPKAEVETPKKIEEEAPVIREEKKEVPDAKAIERKRDDELKKVMQKLKEEAARESALKSLKNREGKIGRKKMAGNILSKGTAGVGAIGATKDQYTAILAQKIKEHFNIYQSQKKKKISCKIYFELNPNGRAKQIKVVTPSSDPLFDSAVLQAVQEAQPLPIPEDLALIRNGITIEFKPE